MVRMVKMHVEMLSSWEYHPLSTNAKGRNLKECKVQSCYTHRTTLRPCLEGKPPELPPKKTADPTEQDRRCITSPQKENHLNSHKRKIP